MRIDHSDMMSQAVGQARERAPMDKAEGAVKETDRRGAPRDELSLSPRCRELLALNRAVMDSPDVREDLVHSLRRQVEDGTYRPAGEQVAAAMLSDLRGLGAG